MFISFSMYSVLRNSISCPQDIFFFCLSNKYWSLWFFCQHYKNIWNSGMETILNKETQSIAGVSLIASNLIDTHRSALGVIAINTRAANRPRSTSKNPWYYQLCFTPPSVSLLCDNGLLGNRHCYKQKVFFQTEPINWLIVSKTKSEIQSHSTQSVVNLRIRLTQDNV